MDTHGTLEETLKLAKEEAESAVHMVNAQCATVFQTLDTYPAIESRVFTHANEAKTTAWLGQNKGWLLLEQGAQVSQSIE